MNTAYFRKSNYPLDETVNNVIEISKKDGWEYLGNSPLPENIGKMVFICKPEWISTIMKEDHNLIGFLPCSISIFKEGNNVLVGTGQPAIIKILTQNQNILETASQLENQIKSLIHKSAGVSDLKPEKIKLYSTTTCPYCMMEKSWLESKKIKHEVVYVDLNQKEAEHMVEKTGQMGVPVTEIQYEGEEVEYIIGFDKTKLSSILQIKD